MSTVTLHHHWTGAAERAALDRVARALGAAGLAWSDAPADDGIELVKMHGQELTAAAKTAPGLVDLARIVAPSRLEWRIFPCAFASMRGAHAALHGVPVGIHRSNALWVHGGRAAAIGGDVPASFDAWEAWLQRAHDARAHPLALTSEPWVLCLLFEMVVLSLEGAGFHGVAFADDGAAPCGCETMRAALQRFVGLRRFVSDATLARSRAELAEQLRAGELACLLMGDWARKDFAAWGAPGADEVVEWPMPGTAGRFVFNVDYFVPVVREGHAQNDAALHTLVETLLSPALQRDFAAVKGSLPTVRDVQAPVRDDEGWSLLRRSVSEPGVMLPSFTFDHTCGVARRAAIAAAVAEAFLGRISIDETLRRIAR